MSKEEVPYPINPKLRAAVAVDYSEASEILVSFPEKWQLVGTMKREDYDLLSIRRTDYVRNGVR